MRQGDVEAGLTDLTAHLESVLDTSLEEPTVSSLSGGNANVTLSLTWPDRELVLRGAPSVEPAPAVLHGLEREYAVLEALQSSDVPVPAVVCYCEESVLGEPCYVMERCHGDVLDVSVPSHLDTPEGHEQIATTIVETLVSIHDVDHTTTGVETVSTEDRLAQFRDQLDWAQERTGEERAVPRLESVGDWLADAVPPAPETTLVHGDYKPDNLLFGPDEQSELAAVLDWELVMAGDPRLDVGWLLSYWSDPGDPDPLTDELRDRYADHPYFPLLEVYVDDYATFTRAETFPDRAAIVDRYETATGRTYEHDRFFRAFGVYKLATLCEGFFRLSLEAPEDAKETHPAMELMVPTLARQAEQIIDGERPL